jgi:uncharacterized protein
MTKQQILNFLTDLKPEANRYGISTLALFGSFARDEARESSDIDIAVKFEDNYLATHDVWAYFDTISKIKSMISSALHAKCDVLDLDSQSYILDNVKKEMIYV